MFGCWLSGKFLSNSSRRIWQRGLWTSENGEFDRSIIGINKPDFTPATHLPRSSILFSRFPSPSISRACEWARVNEAKFSEEILFTAANSSNSKNVIVETGRIFHCITRSSTEAITIGWSAFPSLMRTELLDDAPRDGSENGGGRSKVAFERGEFVDPGELKTRGASSRRRAQPGPPNSELSVSRLRESSLINEGRRLPSRSARGIYATLPVVQPAPVGPLKAPALFATYRHFATRTPSTRLCRN